MMQATRSRAAAHAAAKVWLRGVQRNGPCHPAMGATSPMSGLEAAMSLRLFDKTWAHRAATLHDAMTFLQAVDDLMTDVVVYILKFYGTRYDAHDDAVIAYVYGGFGPMTQAQVIDRELAGIELFHPHSLNLWEETEEAIWA